MNENIDESWADFLKEPSVDAVRMSGGRLFHAAGPASGDADCSIPETPSGTRDDQVSTSLHYVSIAT